MDNKLTLTKMVKHFKKICQHKYYVAQYCFMCGLYWQGIMHDMSKFSPIEFFESARYYKGNDSPIKACKKDKGYSNAWFHHRGRNKHHWEFWVDELSKGMIPRKMPYKYVLELVCDFLGAARAYGAENFAQEYKWWKNKRNEIVMHKATKWYVDTIFNHMNMHGVQKTLTDKHIMTHYKNEYERLK